MKRLIRDCTLVLSKTLTDLQLRSDEIIHYHRSLFKHECLIQINICMIFLNITSRYRKCIYNNFLNLERVLYSFFTIIRLCKNPYSSQTVSRGPIIQIRGNINDFTEEKCWILTTMFPTSSFFALTVWLKVWGKFKVRFEEVRGTAAWKSKIICFKKEENDRGLSISNIIRTHHIMSTTSRQYAT